MPNRLGSRPPPGVCYQLQPHAARWRALVLAALRAAARRPRAPFVWAALRAAALRSAAVRREAAWPAWRDKALRDTVLFGSRLSTWVTARETRGRRRGLRLC